MSRKTFEVPAEYDGVRADRVTAALAGISRSLARRLVEEGAARFDGATVGGRDPVAAGAVLECETSNKETHRKADATGECDTEKVNPADMPGKLGDSNRNSKTDEKQNSDWFAEYQPCCYAQCHRMHQVAWRHSGQ